MGEQTTEKTKLSIKQFMIIFFLGLGYTVVYATPFIQYVFYDSLVDALQCTNQQLGYLITIFGVGNLLAPFGGALSDKLYFCNADDLCIERCLCNEHELFILIDHLGRICSLRIVPLLPGTYETDTSDW